MLSMIFIYNNYKGSPVGRFLKIEFKLVKISIQLSTNKYN